MFLGKFYYVNLQIGFEGFMDRYTYILYIFILVENIYLSKYVYKNGWMLLQHSICCLYILMLAMGMKYSILHHIYLISLQM